MVGLAESAGGAPAGVVEPRGLLNRLFAGVACPAGVVENSEVPPAAPDPGVEPVPGAFPVLAPKRLGADAVLPPNKAPPVAPGVELPPAAVVGVFAALPKRLGVPGLLIPPNIPPPGVPEEAGVAPVPPNSEFPEEGVPVAAALPNKDVAGFCALAPNREPLFAWPPAAVVALLF